jgi:hypothetical protein
MGGGGASPACMCGFERYRDEHMGESGMLLYRDEHKGESGMLLYLVPLVRA